MTRPKDDGVPPAGGRAHDPLEAFFAAGRAEGPAPSPALMARIAADAARLAPAARAAAAPTGAVPRSGAGIAGRLRAVWAALSAPLGGGLGVGGLALATAAGVWIGASAPEALLRVEDRLFAPSLVIELGEEWAALDDL